MQQILSFLEQIRDEKNKIFQAMIEKFESESTDQSWNGRTLKIENQADVFLYIPEDKKSMNSSWGDFDPKIPFSYLVYLSYYHHVANYVNGGLKYIGFYNSKYKKISEIPFDSIKITNGHGGCNFEDLRHPQFNFTLKHKKGNTHASYRGNPKYAKTCQGVIDCIWKLEDFYRDWEYVEIRSPQSLM